MLCLKSKSGAYISGQFKARDAYRRGDSLIDMRKSPPYFLENEEVAGYLAQIEQLMLEELHNRSEV